MLPVINWLLGSIAAVGRRGFDCRWADLRGVTGGGKLAEKVAAAVEWFPCDCLFIHRDAESSEGGVYRHRVGEIRKAMEGRPEPFVPLIPVRMTEAWLLIDLQAVRAAADNPNARAPLDLPPLRQLDQLNDPKETLHELLIAASGKRGRRLADFRRELAWRRSRVADYIADYSPLRGLEAFRVRGGSEGGR
ncbi:MAG: hypothetical protein ACRC33_01005 [Gemmataceae bacterium]